MPLNSGDSWERVSLTARVMMPNGPMEIDITDYLMEDKMILVESEPGDGKKAREAVEKFVAKVPRRKEFGFGRVFDSVLIDNCCVKGVFPMAIFAMKGKPAFAPKLHQNRSVLDLSNYSPKSKSTRKRSKHYRVTVNTHMEEILEAVVRHNGENWMCAPLRKCFVHMWRNPHKYEAKFTSIAIWDQSDSLVASEAGYTVGSVYTSLSGTTEESGAGSVQLAVLGALLLEHGYSHWDFGMQMGYKEELGAVETPRTAWLSLISENRKKNPLKTLHDCSEDIVSCHKVLEGVRGGADSAMMDTEEVRAAKLEKKMRKKEKAAMWLQQHPEVAGQR